MCPTLCNPMDCSCQVPLSMGFSRQECWRGLPFPSPGNLPNPEIEPGSPTLQADSLLFGPPGNLLKALALYSLVYFNTCVLFIIFGCAGSSWVCRLFCSCGEWGLLSNCGCGPFVTMASPLWSTCSSASWFQLQHTGSVVVSNGLSCSRAFEFFPNQGSNLCLLHRQADSLPLNHWEAPGQQLFVGFLLLAY